VDERAPWHLAMAADGGERLDTCLLHGAAAVRVLGSLLHPFLPDASAEILAALGQPSSYAADAATWLDGLDRHAVARPAPIFPRLGDPGG
ncbi:MAG TPA: hypothetical protein VI011_00375, partial [Asanoa sp.]